jgi:hypothetical protein
MGALTGFGSEPLRRKLPGAFEADIFRRLSKSAADIPQRPTRNTGSNRRGCWLSAVFAAQSDGFELLILAGSQSQAKS